MGTSSHTQTVAQLSERRSDASRVRCFNTAKPLLGKQELAILATVDARCHVLVASIEGDSEPAGFAHLFRDNDHSLNTGRDRVRRRPAAG